MTKFYSPRLKIPRKGETVLVVDWDWRKKEYGVVEFVVQGAVFRYPDKTLTVQGVKASDKSFTVNVDEYFEDTDKGREKARDLALRKSLDAVEDYLGDAATSFEDAKEEYETLKKKYETLKKEEKA